MSDSRLIYGEEFYNSRDAETSYSACRIVEIVSKHFPGISSAIDLGCGVGTFLLAWKSAGATIIKGVEGSWLNKDNLLIPHDNFEYVDLEQPFLHKNRYDIAICLEVAEHLSPEGGENLIQTICAQSDLVLFSASIPFQGGIGHLNEAWPSYWSNLFSRHGFFPCDLIRKEIWHDQRIPFWYRQNIMLYTSREDILSTYSTNQPLDIVHPELYLSKCHMRHNRRLAPPKLITNFVRKIRQMWH
jgi:hypothetical protein